MAITAKVTKVTPKIAEKWLGLNETNRPLRSKRVDFFVDLINTGQFVMTGEPIQFSGKIRENTAVLLNGQHRLYAIVLSGKPVELLIVEDVDPSAQLVMDTGAKRMFSDILVMNRNMKNAGQIAAICRAGYFYDSGRFDELVKGSWPEVGHQALLQWFDNNRTAIESAHRIAVLTTRNPTVRANPTAVTLAAMQFDLLDSVESRQFFTDLLDPNPGLNDGDPMLLLRSWFSHNVAVARVRRPSVVVQWAYINKTWNARRRGVAMRSLTWRPFGGEKFPVAE